MEISKHHGKRLVILNRSDWPMWALKVICPEIAKASGIKWNYHFCIRGTDREKWCGRGSKYTQRSMMHRRYRAGKGKWPHTIKEWRYKTVDQRHDVRSRLELFIFLLGHEAAHAIGCDGTKMGEQDANDHGYAMVEHFRRNARWFLQSCRYELARERAANQKPEADDKLQRCAANLAAWERKAKFAQNKIRTYRRKVKYYEGRVAAKQKEKK